jgi:hypothetical protein
MYSIGFGNSGVSFGSLSLESYRSRLKKTVIGKMEENFCICCQENVKLT